MVSFKFKCRCHFHFPLANCGWHYIILVENFPSIASYSTGPEFLHKYVASIFADFEKYDHGCLLLYSSTLSLNREPTTIEQSRVNTRLIESTRLTLIHLIHKPIRTVRTQILGKFHLSSHICAYSAHIVCSMYLIVMRRHFVLFLSLP
jgi:hypothetical protein